jgi:hypothetical protein
LESFEVPLGALCGQGFCIGLSHKMWEELVPLGLLQCATCSFTIGHQKWQTNCECFHPAKEEHYHIINNFSLKFVVFPPNN